MKKEKILKKVVDIASKELFFFFEEGKNSAIKLVESGEYYQIIFSHDFAKAFWDSFFVCNNCGYKEGTMSCMACDNCLTEDDKRVKIPNWRYHLQQMVLEKEPLKYLEKFL